MYSCALAYDLITVAFLCLGGELGGLLWHKHTGMEDMRTVTNKVLFC